MLTITSSSLLCYLLSLLMLICSSLLLVICSSLLTVATLPSHQALLNSLLLPSTCHVFFTLSLAEIVKEYASLSSTRSFKHQGLIMSIQSSSRAVMCSSWGIGVYHHNMQHYHHHIVEVCIIIIIICISQTVHILKSFHHHYSSLLIYIIIYNITLAHHTHS